MAVNTTNFSTPNQAITGTLKRTVSDKIRKLFPGTAIMALVQSGMIGGGDSEVVRKTGVISKRRVDTPKYEVFNYNPLAITFTVGTASDGSDVIINGNMRDRLPNTSNLLFRGVESNKLIPLVSDIELSAGSACTSAFPKPSHVLKAMGLDEKECGCSIRFSLGRFTSEDQIYITIKKITAAINSIRSTSI